ncbi:aldose 1-epimerase family protein [Homoserinibacter sp. GY 40078]|uniref:aldose 1-epimerase family protein n=1 Tax=Homoserinibacter sp. GY 40078 TaxID=2603275 RepID=UPI0011CA27AD|nr:aldose 1-epimerase family protein [Homoserinibacter sp. GY 40078]TXK19285.1 aldose 1-epimerase family protein [Homoserinibacter sp. GY 40078]
MSTVTGVGERFTLRAGDTEVEVGTVAAVLCSARVGGVDIVEPLADGVAPPPFCSGIALAPWPNRVRAGQWTYDGAVQQLDITEPARGGALHGLLEFAEYEVRELTESQILLGATIHPQHGWPFLVDTWVRIEALADGLRMTHGARNLSDRRAPFAAGTHPYPRIGEVDVAELVLTAHADEYLEVDERLDPIAWHPVEGGTDLRGGVPVGALALDTAFRGLRPADGVTATLAAPDGRRLEIFQDDDWRYLQVFTTPIFPRPAGPGTAVAIEPMTAPPDALNSGDDLVWLEPGESYEGSWGLRYLGV